MLVGINLMAWTDIVGPEDLSRFSWLKALGYDGVEIPLLDLDRVDVSSIRSALAASDLRCTASTALPDHASLIDPRGIPAGMAFLRQCLELAKEIGAEVLCGPLYSPVGQGNHPPTASERTLCASALRDLVPLAERYRIRLAVEPLNRFETGFLNTVADAVDLVKQVDRQSVGLLADTFHMNIEEKDPAQSLRAAGSSLVHVHFSENDRGIVGSGHTPWSEVMNALWADSYDGWIVFETFAGHLPQLAAATAIWRPLVESPERYAEASLRAFRSWEFPQAPRREETMTT